MIMDEDLVSGHLESPKPDMRSGCDFVCLPSDDGRTAKQTPGAGLNVHQVQREQKESSPWRSPSGPERVGGHGSLRVGLHAGPGACQVPADRQDAARTAAARLF